MIINITHYTYCFYLHVYYYMCTCNCAEMFLIFMQAADRIAMESKVHDCIILHSICITLVIKTVFHSGKY